MPLHVPPQRPWHLVLGAVLSVSPVGPYMVDGQGFLITNRKIVSEDIQDLTLHPNVELRTTAIRRVSLC
jgi:hypothetical protein